MSRERRRRRTQYTGIWRGDREVSVDQPILHSAIPGLVYISWRIVSLVAIALLLVLLLVIVFADRFVVRDIGVAGAKYLTQEEIFALSEVANLHVLSVSPETVRQSILRSPSIADARITIGWDPLIQVDVIEREPALIWEQGETRQWVDNQGRIMSLRSEQPDLMRITAPPNVVANPFGKPDRIASDIVFGALQLKELLKANDPDFTDLRYDPVDGLGYTDPDGWEIWFGVGTDMPEKLQIYQALLTSVQAEDIKPLAINVADPDAPFYKLSLGS